MNIKGFNVTQDNCSSTGLPQIFVKDVSDLSPLGFDIRGTFESGQCIRWKKVEDGKYYGIVKGRAVNVSLFENGRDLVIENATLEDFRDIWFDYFDLGTNYAPIIKEVEKDDFMQSAIRFSGGARMLVQDFEETLYSYILSSQNNIPRIIKLVDSLCSLYGEKIYAYPSFGDKTLMGHSFPDSETLALNFCTKEGCESCGSRNGLCDKPFAGYRCPYIRKTALMIYSGEFILDENHLASSTAEQARKELCRLSGVGEKVADCVLLYSGIRKDICPIDVWVEKTIKHFYLDESAKKSEIRKFTQDYFGKHAGYAQLWFFNYSRTQKPV